MSQPIAPGRASVPFSVTEPPVGKATRPASGTPIRVEFTRLANLGIAARAGASDSAPADNVLRIVLGSGRGSVLHDAAMPPFLVAPLRGTVRVIDGHCTRLLRARRLFVAEHGGNLQIVGGMSALWIAVIAPARLWRKLFEATADAPMSEPILLTAAHAADPAILRAMIRVARAAAEEEAGRIDAINAAMGVAARLAELQASFDACIDRCPGRTQAQRRAVFSRLQRVHSWMEWGTDLSVELPTFARAAGYSTCHFVRIFNAVYGETPYAALVERRLDKARTLIHSTELSITEIARAAGFIDRCAFARSFKRRFGNSASAMRNHRSALVG
ncbi:MAG TPA: AraC family transcriptional regulator [Rhodanobacteraceae bacterium]|nr:AraC family transcriptional regulator [Rhodanobacteraceae bacterium]